MSVQFPQGVNPNDFMTEIVGAETDGEASYTLLPPGQYMARIEKPFFRYSEARNPVVEMCFTITTEDGQQGRAYENLVLIPSCEWKARAFFKALGWLKTGQRFAYNWNVEGCMIPVNVDVEDYEDKNGNPRKKNIIKSFRIVKDAPPAFPMPDPTREPQPDTAPAPDDDIPF